MSTPDPHHGRFVGVPAAYVFLVRGRPTARPATPGGTEVLLQLRRDTGYMDGHWAAAAAGHVEQGETAYDAARREALEEIGVSDVDLAFVTAMQRTRGGEPIDERVDFFFTATAWSGEPYGSSSRRSGRAALVRPRRPGRPARPGGAPRTGGVGLAPDGYDHPLQHLRLRRRAGPPEEGRN